MLKGFLFREVIKTFEIEFLRRLLTKRCYENKNIHMDIKLDSTNNILIHDLERKY